MAGTWEDPVKVQALDAQSDPNPGQKRRIQIESRLETTGTRRSPL